MSPDSSEIAFKGLTNVTELPGASTGSVHRRSSCSGLSHCQSLTIQTIMVDVFGAGRVPCSLHKID